ncbi:carboxypeptidase regulatory-like domain-containing protein [Micromonospora sp. WMMD1082]|nr:carboxypeptidase regulatory-like domain-containing protein [Micromonospora sp. WMMD1082]MDG4794891.1 carboxypeptidase regulatory-like domain-containing protein [Micromonospora sp. WMMD1082]
MALIVGALLAVPATPAFAAPSVNNVSASPSRVEAGRTTVVRYSIGITDDNAADITVSSNNPRLSCVDGCSRGGVNESGNFQATFRLAGDAADGQATITVRAVDATGEQSQSTNVTLVGAAAPPPPPPTTQAPQTVRSISGKVVNQGGEAVSGALVLLKDSAGKQRETNTNGDGNFRFTGSSDNPIAPGRIDLGASASGVQAVSSFTANAGQSVTGRRITLAIQASASPSATPSASESALPTEDPFEDEFAEEDEAAEESVAAQAPASNEDSGGGFGSWLLILLGGLFVAVGVGTIVLLWMKRRENEDAETDGDAPAGAPAGAIPAARGSYANADDHTRVVNRVGAGPDPTMVGGPGLSNAPTMMHQPVLDDVPPDPYGAPPQPYGAPGGQAGWSGGGYGDEPGGYGAPGYGNAPSSGSGYGNSPSSGGGYGSRDYGAGNAGTDYPPAGTGAGYGERYDEPTGRYSGEESTYPAPADPYATGVYQPEAGQGYGQPEPGGYGRNEAGGYGQSEPTRGYGQSEPGGYGQSDSTRGYGQGEPAGDYGQPDSTRGYGQAGSGYGTEPTGGYDQPGGGYGQEPPRQRGGYDNTSYDNAYDQGGYGQESQSRGGYESGGYGQAGGYGQEPPRQRDGYDNGYEAGGYGGQGGGYGGDPAQAGRGRSDGPSQDRGGRRLDWLDD